MVFNWLVIFILLMSLGIPIAIAIGIAGSIAIFLNGSIDLIVIILRLFTSVDSFLLIAAPLFILVGNILTQGKLSDPLFDFADSLVGWVRGGLGYANIVASIIFGGISGSSTADAAGLGIAEVREMEARGYPKDWSAGITVASSTLAILIPPSVIMIIYAMTAQQSAVKCLLAGLIPGLIMALMLMIVWFLLAKKKNWPSSQPFRLKNIFIKFKKAFSILIIPVVFIIGLMFGFFTPTEGAAVISVYSLVLTCFIYKTLSFKQVYKVFIDTVKISGSILFLICTSSISSYIFAYENVPQRVSDFIIMWIHNPILILIAVNLFFILCVLNIFLLLKQLLTYPPKF